MKPQEEIHSGVRGSEVHTPRSGSKRGRVCGRRGGGTIFAVESPRSKPPAELAPCESEPSAGSKVQAKDRLTEQHLQHVPPSVPVLEAPMMSTWTKEGPTATLGKRFLLASRGVSPRWAGGVEPGHRARLPEAAGSALRVRGFMLRR